MIDEPDEVISKTILNRAPYDLHLGDSLEILKALPDNSIDSVVTDPPYELGFMDKAWDKRGIANDVSLWAEVFRVLKPGGHMVAFGGTRTAHRMVCAIEDAGFEIRDTVAWIYGSGFPKSHDVSKGIDKAAGAEREVVGKRQFADGSSARRTAEASGVPGSGEYGQATITAPATDAAKQWDGWGTALKPAWENITLARKPLSEPTVAANVLRWGTGAINVDGCRVGTTRGVPVSLSRNKSPNGFGPTSGKGGLESDLNPNIGRWPANLCHDGSQEVLDLFPESKSTGDSGPASKNWKGDGHTVGAGLAGATGGFGDSGSAARFFYCAKASKSDRAGSKHPTVKPVNLIRWLVRLVTPPGGIVLDPFAGSGTTGEAAILEGFHPVLIEKEEEYCNDIHARLSE